MISSRTRSSNEVLNDLKEHYPRELLKTVMPRNVTITDSMMAGYTAVRYCKTATASRSYFELAKEIERKLKMKS